jgi:hypothetical protein
VRRRVALVAVAAEELGDLGFQRGLDHQTHTEAGGLLQRLGQRLTGGEQLVDLGADALGRGYWCGHGRRPSGLELALDREPTPVSLFHQTWDATVAELKT